MGLHKNTGIPACSGRRNTIGFTDSKLQEFLDRLETKTSQTTQSEARSFVRWPLREGQIQITIEENGISRRTLKLASRNLSNHGIGLLHSSYIYPGSKCTVSIPSRTKGRPATDVHGTTMRCVHIDGLVHEVGIAFDKPIDASLFVAKLLTIHSGSDTIDPSSLKGRILHIDGSEADLKLISHYLKSTEITIDTAGCIALAKKKCAAPYNLIVCDLNLPDGTGADLVKWMREQGITTPVAIMTATPMNHLRERMNDLEIQGVLIKPVNKKTLLSAMAELMTPTTDETDSGDFNALDQSDPDVIAILEAFKKETVEIVKMIKTAIEQNDALEIYAIANRLLGTSSAIGFDQISKVAGRTAESLAATMSCEESKAHIETLLVACQNSLD